MENFHALIIGSGAAAYNCADCLYEQGVRDIAILTENRLFGTSRNTGSDKQTYYKLGIAGDQPDSVYKMAEALYSGGGVDGDVCLTEAANSLKAFYKLCSAGVPFPTNRYGEYVGYKTDHDPLQRATSVGPLTSKLMTEALESRVREKGIRIYDKHYVAQIVVHKGRAVGVVAVSSENDKEKIRAFSAQNIILATGGPAAVYRDSVYPACHTGSSSLAIRAGAQMSNLCEWQYGLASTKFRWNVSGTYQQVLPRYIAVSSKGIEREFLPEYYPSPEKALDMVFLKGYQWPFDSAKISGSSQIDLIVQYETNVLGNRVFMDFTRNPVGVGDFSSLGAETRAYLEKSGAMQATPLARLEKMNPAAIELYKSHGIDLAKEPLEVAVCAQHCNGGVLVDSHYESSVPHLYVCGEAAGTFGLYRPGGSALNSGQVGAMRAAERISEQGFELIEGAEEALESAAARLREEIFETGESEYNAAAIWKRIRNDMSRYASDIRIPSELNRMAEEWRTFPATLRKRDGGIIGFLKSRDAQITAGAIVDAMRYACAHAGSRGGAIYAKTPPVYENGVLKVVPVPEKTEMREEIIVTVFKENKFETSSRRRRPIPVQDDWFENVWREYRDRMSLKEGKTQNVSQKI